MKTTMKNISETIRPGSTKYSKAYSKVYRAIGFRGELCALIVPAARTRIFDRITNCCRMEVVAHLLEEIDDQTSPKRKVSWRELL